MLHLNEDLSKVTFFNDVVKAPLLCLQDAEVLFAILPLAMSMVLFYIMHFTGAQQAI